MQRLSDEQLLREIDEVMPLVAACEPSPETRRILKELESGRQNLVGNPVDSTAAQIAERASLLAQVEPHAELANRLIVIGQELEDRECRSHVTPEEILRQLEKLSPDLWSLYHDLRHWSHWELFEFLFPIACDAITYPWPAPCHAATLLVRIEPRCPITCREALVRLSAGSLEPSLPKLPFYLVTQFGKHTVLKGVAELLEGDDLSDQARSNLNVVRYWSSAPAISLLRGESLN